MTLTSPPPSEIGNWMARMTPAMQVSTAVVYQWKDGTVKRPSDASLERLCAAYGLDFWEVMALTRRRGPIKIRRVPVPIAGGSTNDGTKGVDAAIDVLRLVRLWLRAGLYRWGLSSIRTPRLACA